MEYPRIITSGDTAIVVEFEDKIDPSINAKALLFVQKIREELTKNGVEIAPIVFSEGRSFCHMDSYNH